MDTESTQGNVRRENQIQQSVLTGRVLRRSV